MYAHSTYFGIMWMNTFRTHGDMLCVAGERKWTFKIPTVTIMDNETNIMVNSRYFPSKGTAREVGGIISANSRKNTVRESKMEIQRVTWNNILKSSLALNLLISPGVPICLGQNVSWSGTWIFISLWFHKSGFFLCVVEKITIYLAKRCVKDLFCNAQKSYVKQSTHNQYIIVTWSLVSERQILSSKNIYDS